MELLNEQVTHKSFGEGNVVGYDDSFVEVQFSLGNKKFVFPDVFGTHLILVDPKLAERVEKMKRDVQAERLEQSAEEERVRVMEEAERQRLLEREKLIQNHKLSPVSQAAFWCDQDEAETVFTEWRIFTGLKKSGKSEGTPNKLVRLAHNSCCLITAREPDMKEEDRYILGLFMVDESFIGKLCEDGYIPAHQQYRLRLSDQESRKLLFWNYYLNERYPTSMTWNSGGHRYFDNIWMAQILQDIVALKKGTEDLKLAENFLKHFCQMNRLVEADLPKPNGALLRR